MKKTTLLSAVLISLAGLINAQTYYGTGGIIPDNGTPVTFTIEVNGLPGSGINTSFGLESVCLTIMHPWDADLDVAFIAPDSSLVMLTSGLGEGGDNYINTCFNGNSDESILNGNPPFIGTYRPIGDLGVVNNGQNGNGTWTLYILDTYPYADQGSLVNWNVTFSDTPSIPMPFISSNLPIVVINTHGLYIPDDPKIEADMGIIDNGPGAINYITDPFNDYNGKIGIEKRGSTSQFLFPKKSFGIETWDSSGNEIEVPLMGLPEESDWILNANYSDKTLMRNVMAYHFYNKMGNYASHTRYCELFLNGQYTGIYILMEKIKRDNNRVDIATLLPEDTSGIELTGGYILKIDKITGSGGEGWTSPYPPPVSPSGQTIFFQYEYPDFEDLQPQQINYIQEYTDSFETALYNFGSPGGDDYKNYVDIGSCAEYFIINEICKNIDSYRLSTFFYKDKGGKFRMGPPWDYDLAWRNAYYCLGSDYNGWAYQFGDVCPNDYWQVPFWWEKLLTDSFYLSQLKCRWDELRENQLSNSNLMNSIDSLHLLLNESQERNFQQWPILGVYVWPNPYPIPETYEEEVEVLKTWIVNRMNWLDNNMPGECWNSSEFEIFSENIVKLLPNPAKDKITIYLPAITSNTQLSIHNVSGEKVLERVLTNNETQIDISALPREVYFVRVQDERSIKTVKMIKQ